MTAAHFIRPGATRTTIASIVAAVFLSACGDDPTRPPPGAGDPENISEVTITLAPVGTGATTASTRHDPDGSQLPQPVGAASATLALVKGKTYNGSIELLNNIAAPVIDISAEVEEEGDFHRFFYTFVGCTGVANPDPATFDKDTQAVPQPVGLTFQVVVPAGAATTASCTLHVELHHFESNKGDGTGTNFETDLSIDFPVSVSP